MFYNEQQQFLIKVFFKMLTLLVTGKSVLVADYFDSFAFEWK